VKHCLSIFFQIKGSDNVYEEKPDIIHKTGTKAKCTKLMIVD